MDKIYIIEKTRFGTKYVIREFPIDKRTEAETLASTLWRGESVFYVADSKDGAIKP